MSDHHDGHDHIHPAPKTFLTKYVFSTDHKVIGIQFLFAALFFVVYGALLALAVRYQIAWPQQNVPYHALLPGKEGTDVSMTNAIPEMNVAHWKVGGEVILGREVVLEEEGRRFPAGAKAKLVGFPEGIAVTVQPNTLVRRDGVDAVTEVRSEPLDVMVSASSVMGDYAYSRYDAQTSAGTRVTYTDEQGQSRTLILEGARVHRPHPQGLPASDDIRTITLPTRRDATMVELEIPDQTIKVRNVADLDRFDLGDEQKAALAGQLEAIRAHNDEMRQKRSEYIAEASQHVDADDPAVMQGLTRAAREKYRDKFDYVLVPVQGGHIESISASAVNFTKHWLTDNAYLTLFTMHATIMIFFVLMPVLLGTFANFLIPLMIGARDMAFPKLNMLSFWIAVPAGIIMLVSFWVPGGAAGAGWTSYPPLAQSEFNSGLGVTLWIAAIGLVGFSTIVGTLNYITTVINMRAPGLSMFRLPLTIWSLFITAILALFATPVLTAAAILLFFDRVLGTVFFMPTAYDAMGEVILAGGQPLLWQHLFWFFGHPEVYILILPTMGIASEVLAVHARKPIFGYKPMVFAMVAISGLGFIVWGHHMFQSGMNPLMGTTFMAATIMIAVPSAIKTFNWLGTIWGGNIRFTPAMLFALGFVSMFVIGGLSGIFMASAPVDIQLHDTYFIVAHIHYVFFGGTLFGIFAGLYHWFPKMFGRQMNQRWGVIHFILTIIAFNGTFFLMHVLGIGGHPRRYAAIMEFPTLVHLQPMNVIMTIFAMMLGVSQLPFIYNLFVSLPRNLGRNITALFAILLAGPIVLGGIYWGGFTGEGGAGSRLLHALWGHDPAGLTAAQRFAGYALFLAALAYLGYLFLTQLGRGGRIATVICGGLLVVFSLMAIRAGGSGDAGTTMQLAHDFIVALGLAVPFAVAAVAGVFVIWAIGGKLGLSAILASSLYVLIGPLYVMPILFKPDVFVWIGMPELFEWRWALLLVSAIPGTAYLALARPRDQFGYVTDINPWQANSLEWVVPSPPPHHNFDEIPTVYRGPYEYGTPVVEEDYLPQADTLPEGVVEPAGH